MGIYAAKFALESTVGSDQTSNNINDSLYKIKSIITNPNSNNNAIEEACIIMYESQYIYEQIMKYVGVYESSNSTRNSIIFETFDIKGFFGNIKKIISDIFERISTAFKKFISVFNNQTNADKKFVSQYRSKIIAGAKNFKGGIKGYLFPNNITFGGADHKGTELIWHVNEALKYLQNGEDFDIKEVENNIRTETIEGIAGVKAETIEDMNKKLTIKLHGGIIEKVDLKGKISGEQVIAILSNDSEAKAIEKSYNAVKGSYNEALKKVDNLEKIISNKKFPDMVKAMAVLKSFANIITFESNVQSSVYKITLQAVNDKRAQARALAHAYNKAASSVQHNSVYTNGSIFSDMQFV